MNDLYGKQTVYFQTDLTQVLIAGLCIKFQLFGILRYYVGKLEVLRFEALMC